MKVLEALETVGEEEMLAKLEESILTGSVPGPHASYCPLSKPLGHQSPNGAASSTFSPPGGATNTILRHPGTSSSLLVLDTRNVTYSQA